MEPDIKYQMRGEYSAYPIIDIISASVIKLSESDVSKEERKVLSNYCALINEFLSLERCRESEVSSLTCAFLVGKESKARRLIRKIDKITNKISELESRIMLIEDDHVMQRIIALGEEYLQKNPALKAQYKRYTAKSSQEHQIWLAKSHYGL